ncbi:MAG TPA: polysaccharide deacetylase family protein [Allosphingosinicella sp.]|nr:polysaccharide deacetylase family protein [Allosphingosinicella sp.]
MPNAWSADLPQACRRASAPPEASVKGGWMGLERRRRRPQLAIVVDTEEEFDWRGPFSRDNIGTSSIAAQARAHQVYDRLGAVPTYVVDYPVAADPAARALLGQLRADGRAEIGAHLHPWVCPPHEEEVSRFNSYHCNLPPALERAKIEALTAAIEEGFGSRPTVFKAGRYGFGRSTAATIAQLGYKIDCSFVPHASFAADGGPSFHGTPDRPFWLDVEQRLLEVPLTAGFIGAAGRFGSRLRPVFESRLARRLRVPGLLARTGLVARSTLTPEGVSADEQIRLLKTLIGRGHSFFTMVYHSPSLAPGNTPYVRDAAELGAFLGRIEKVLSAFCDDMDGEFTTLTRYRAALLGEAAQ